MSLLAQAPVLVLGGLGFIGVNLTPHLQARGARVTVLTPSRERHAGRVESLERSGVRVVEGDMRDHALMARLVAGQHVVFNVAGHSGAVRSMEDPWSDLDVNVRGNLVLLEALREVNPEGRVVFAGSRLQYGRVDRTPVVEDAAREPLSIHALHKQLVEDYLALYRRLFGIHYTVARITNPYGPGQPAGRTAYGVINRLIHLALEDGTLAIYGDGRQQRDYVHIDDVVAALIGLAESSVAEGRVYNVGSGQGASIRDVAAQIVALAGRGRVAHVPWPPLAERIETGDFVADITRIRDDIGWTPLVDLESGLRQTIGHYRDTAAS